MRVQSLRVKEWLAWLFLPVPGPAGEQNSSLASCNTCCVDSFVSHRIFSRDIALQFCCWEPETSDAFSGLTLTCGPHRSTHNCRHLRFYSDSLGSSYGGLYATDTKGHLELQTLPCSGSLTSSPSQTGSYSDPLSFRGFVTLPLMIYSKTEGNLSIFFQNPVPPHTKKNSTE